MRVQARANYMLKTNCLSLMNLRPVIAEDVRLSVTISVGSCRKLRLSKLNERIIKPVPNNLAIAYFAENSGILRGFPSLLEYIYNISFVQHARIHFANETNFALSNFRKSIKLKYHVTVQSSTFLNSIPDTHIIRAGDLIF